MSVANWNFALNAILVVLAVSYGFWLRRIVAQQLSGKDATIEALRTGVESQKAEVERLRGMSAPRITEEWKTMKDFAEDMAKQKQQAGATLKELEAAMKASASRLLTHTELVAAAVGLMEAVSAIDNVLRCWSLESGLSGDVKAPAVMDWLVQVRNKLAEEGRAALDGKLPEWHYIKTSAKTSAS